LFLSLSKLDPKKFSRKIPIVHIEDEVFSVEYIDSRVTRLPNEKFLKLEALSSSLTYTTIQFSMEMRNLRIVKDATLKFLKLEGLSSSLTYTSSSI
jgi:hypothetical protein